MYKAFLFATVLICAGTVATAQPTKNGAQVTGVPRLVHFSGTFRPPGNQAPGPVGATFAVYREQEGGTALWNEDQNVELDANGNYTVMLGATRNDGVPPELFAGGEARWLQVTFHLPDAVSRPRVLLVSVPYALKAADAETIGGLPPSAFMLAPLAANGGAATASSRETTTSASPAVSGTGTTDFVPLWLNNTGTLGNSVLFQSGAGSTAKIGINSSTPGATLDVNGSETVRGALALPVTGTATASGGKKSQPLKLTSSSFNSGTGTAQSQTFQLQAQAAGNNTSNPTGSLNFLFGAGTAAPAETGLKIGSNGVITFATGQTFPGGGGGTVTSVGSGAGLTGGPITGSGTLSIATGGVSNSMLANSSLTLTPGTGLTGGGLVSLGSSTTLNLDTTKVPLLNAANTFTGNQTVNGNLTATGVVTGSSYQIGSSLFAFGSTFNTSAYLGFAGNSTASAIHVTGVGYQALKSLTSGSYNTAIGNQALTSDTTGDSNTALGMTALFNNITGGQNTALGYGTLYGNNSTQNTAGGFESLFTNTTGSANTAYGYYSMLDNITGTGNTAIGASAMKANVLGSNNTAVGEFAGWSTPLGDRNTFVGYQAGPGVSFALTNATAIGANATVNQFNALVLGGTGSNAVTVGIGTAAPYFDYALDVEATPGGEINGGVVSNGTGGNIYLGMTNKVHKFRVDTNGVTYADGGFQSSGADFAESFAVRGHRSLYEPGDVLAIDQKSNRQLTLSNHAYAKLVAGIYSTKPGLLASPHHIDDPAVQSSEVPLAVVGIVPCKVTAQNGPIARGDLLVTSSLPGYAMKGTDRRRMLGAVVGKALEPLPTGTGVIQVLVTLQ